MGGGGPVHDALMTDEGEPRKPDEQAPQPTGEKTEQEAPPTQPAPTTPAPAERRLVRRPEGKMIAGVCSGLGAYTGVDPVAWRIGFVVLALVSGGLVILAYIVAWLVMPMAREGDPLPPPPSDPTRFRRWVGIGAVVLGAVVLFRNTFEIRGSIFWGLLLIGVGLAFWGWELSGRNGTSSPPPLSVPSTPTAPPPPPVGGGSPPMPPVPPVRTAPAASSAPAPSPGRREPSMLGRLVVGAAALAVGIAVLLGNTDVVDVTAEVILVVLLVIVAVGLLIGARWGRARWLIIPGVLLVFALAAATTLPRGFGGSYGDVVVQPTRLSDLRSSYEHAGGNVLLDLRQTPFRSADREVDVRLNFGNLTVLVPPDVPVVVHAQVTGGNIDVFGKESNGWRVGDTVRDEGDDELGTLTVNTRVGFGNLVVRRAEPGDAVPDVDDRFHFEIGPGPRVRVENGDRGTR